MTEAEKKEEKAEKKEERKPIFKIETFDDFKRVITIARGGDPDAIQAVAKFMNLESSKERSYFPDKITTLAIGQCDGYGKLYYPEDDWNPYSLVAEAICEAFMGFKGFKSNQFMEMTRQTPNLSALQTQPEPVKQSVLSGIFNRGGQ